MTTDPVFVGIDVAKHTLDVAIHGSADRWTVPNTEAGVAGLVERLTALGPTRIVLEATGGLERPGVAALAAAGLPVVVINPRQARDFAKPWGSWPRRTRGRWEPDQRPRVGRLITSGYEHDALSLDRIVCNAGARGGERLFGVGGGDGPASAAAQHR